VCKQLDWLDEPVTCGHFRTHDGDEVDLVMERMDGSVAAVKVKAGSRPSAAKLNGLRTLRRKLGAQFLGGVVLYTGSRAYTIDDRLHVLPLDRLWRTMQRRESLEPRPKAARRQHSAADGRRGIGVRLMVGRHRAMLDTRCPPIRPTGKRRASP
jgi:hypothetical protein